MQEREYLNSREHPHYCTCVECQTKRTAPPPQRLSSSEKKRRRKARQKAAQTGTESIDSLWSDDRTDQIDPEIKTSSADGNDSSDRDQSVDSLLDKANDIVKQTPKPGPAKNKRRRKKK